MIIRFTSSKATMLMRLCVMSMFLLLPIKIYAEQNTEFRNSSVWVNARGFVQHLHALQSTPYSHFIQFADQPSVRQTKQLTDCISRTDELPRLFLDCSSSALQEVRQIVERGERIPSPLITQMKVYSALAESSKHKLTWQAWLNFAVIELLTGDLSGAEKKFSLAWSVRPGDSWSTERLRLFEAGLRALSSMARGEAVSNIKSSEATGDSAHDTQTEYLRGRLSQILNELTPKKMTASTAEDAEKTLVELARKRWIVQQDLAEIQALRSSISAYPLTMDVLRRIDSLLSLHGVQNKEWRAIMASLVQMTARGEALLSQQGLGLAIESWLQGISHSGTVLKIDDDQTIDRFQRVVDEFITRLAFLLADVEKQLQRSEDKSQVNALNERMRGMLTAVGRIINGTGVEENVQIHVAAARSLAKTDTRLRRGRAILAALELQDGQRSEQLVEMIKGFRIELETLQSERNELLIRLMSSTTQLIPLTQAQAEGLQLRIRQVRSSLDDLRRVVAGQSDSGFSGTQASQFFLDSSQLLDRISAEARVYLTEKQKQNSKVASVFGSVARDLSILKKDLSELLANQSPLLRPMISRIISDLEKELRETDRAFELKEQIAKSEVQGRITNERVSEEWKRERLNDLRRIRSENLEWRFGR